MAKSIALTPCSKEGFTAGMCLQAMLTFLAMVWVALVF